MPLIKVPQRLEPARLEERGKAFNDLIALLKCAKVRVLAATAELVIPACPDSSFADNWQPKLPMLSTN
jgi:hypothetical protein